jgi:hypothetical protein
MAQSSNVYSVNVVGYVSVPVPTEFSLIANPLSQTDNSIGSLIPNPPVGTTVYTYDNVTGYSVSVFDEFDEAWLPDPGMPLNMGDGFFIYNPSSEFTITYVGEVAQGPLSTPLPLGFSIKASMVPQEADVATLGFPAAIGDTIYKYDNVTGYSVYIFDEFDEAWLPSVPTLKVAEAFFVNKQDSTSWDRTFTVE